MDGETEKPHPTLKLSYPHFEKKSRQYSAKKEKREPLLMTVYLLAKSGKNLSKPILNKAIPGTAASYEIS